MMEETQMKTIDLFAGCGGLTLGLKKAGYEIISAYDNWQKSIDVYKENFSHPINKVDLGNISNEELNKMKALKPDIIVGGPPCQDYSSAGTRNELGERADLTISFARIVAFIKPKYFIMENVDLIKNTEKLEDTKKILKKEGYNFSHVTLDSSYYNVPQKRKRFFLVGEIG